MNRLWDVIVFWVAIICFEKYKNYTMREMHYIYHLCMDFTKTTFTVSTVCDLWHFHKISKKSWEKIEKLQILKKSFFYLIWSLLEPLFEQCKSWQCFFFSTKLLVLHFFTFEFYRPKSCFRFFQTGLRNLALGVCWKEQITIIWLRVRSGCTVRKTTFLFFSL